MEMFLISAGVVRMVCVKIQTFCGFCCFSVPRVLHGARYGSTRGPIHMSELQCSGDEQSLLQCDFVSADNHHCGPEEEIGVICTGTLLVELQV